MARWSSPNPFDLPLSDERPFLHLTTVELIDGTVEQRYMSDSRRAPEMDSDAAGLRIIVQVIHGRYYPESYRIIGR